MAKEVERKFLVEGTGWRQSAEPGVALTQFYLAAGADRSVRVRIANGERAMVALKFGGASLVRDEFEYPIPVGDARAMEPFALGNVIEKTRHLVRHRGRAYEVDIFARSLAGLVIAELETPDQVPADELPGWLGREVTGDHAYYNASLALHGAPDAR